MKRVRSVIAAVLSLSLLGLTTVACGSSTETDRDNTFVFAGSAKPVTLDPIFTDITDNLRIDQQMFETLIANRPGTAQLGPGLAEDWNFSDGGKTITFYLQRNVKFQDGTKFNASAVCYNFDRWYHTTSVTAQNHMTYYTGVFGGFAQNTAQGLSDPIYNSCKANDQYTAEIHLNRFVGALPAAFTLPAFAISSPSALRKYNADTMSQTGEGPDAKVKYSNYANSHPTGTGPYMFSSWDQKSGTVRMVRNPHYWNGKARIRKLEIRTVEDKADRRKQLTNGDIDGYDYPATSDYQSLRDKGFQIHTRPAFNLLYLGINQSHHSALSDVRVRKALVYAVNRKQLRSKLFPEGSTVATQFVPEISNGYANNVVTYGYDPGKAKELLKQAGATNLTLNFYYPTAIDRPYLNNPKGVFDQISADLQAVGIHIIGKALPWADYLTATRDNGEDDLEILGFSGDYNDPGNFLGTLFGRERAEFGYNQPKLFDAISAADEQTDPDAHASAYQQVNRDLMDKYLPAVPLVNSPPALVASKDIRGLIVSPTTYERFDTVYRK